MKHLRIRTWFLFAMSLSCWARWGYAQDNENNELEIELNTKQAFLQDQHPPPQTSQVLSPMNIQDDKEDKNTTPSSTSEELEASSDSKVLTWLQNNWPYLVGGALLGGTVAFFAIDPKVGSTTKQGEPQFHFKTSIH